MTKKSRMTIIASIGLLFTSMIWGFAFVVVKDSLDAMPPIYYACNQVHNCISGPECCFL
jgi:hypothetical protein